MNAVTIEDLGPEHFQLAAQWLSAKTINRWLTGEWRNRTTDPRMLAITVRNHKNRLFLVRCDSIPCGLVGLADIDFIDKTAMAWYLLGHERFARRGITSAALQQMIRRAFDETGLESIYAWIMEDNEASQGVLRKSGFQPCGRIRNATLSNGHRVDRLYFDVVRETA